jgi:hypothetical protein
MYCRKCGKYMEGNAQFCDDCINEAKMVLREIENIAATDATEVDKKEEVKNDLFDDAPQVDKPVAPIAQPVTPVARPIKNERMNGFGPALTSTIMGFFGFIFAYVALILMIVMIGVPFWLMSIGLTIPSLIMGIKSIKVFKDAGRLKRAKPIATLILGIAGTSLAGFAAFFDFIALFLLTLI